MVARQACAHFTSRAAARLAGVRELVQVPPLCRPFREALVVAALQQDKPKGYVGTCRLGAGRTELQTQRSNTGSGVLGRLASILLIGPPQVWRVLEFQDDQADWKSWSWTAACGLCAPSSGWYVRAGAAGPSTVTGSSLLLLLPLQA
ncbi:hypothetical protein WJX72_003869 [[Myrmecia] bisecta]|uniref:Uncharacterized protein n=1 Tax=[Myrmecia] bisecta TaxID=41462 RepID=A0AAW1P633_9CHLO